MVTATRDPVTLEQLSDETGASIRSLRYYISRGWLPQPQPSRQGNVGRPPGMLEAAAVEKVLLIRKQLHGSNGHTPTVYRYEVSGEAVESEVVETEEDDRYLLLVLANGDRILRRKAMEGA